MRCPWALALLATGLTAMTAERSPAGDFQKEIKQAFAACRAIQESEQRLKCYDELQGRLEPPRWQGRLSITTEPFTIDRPTVLRYESEGVIFVMYLRDDKDHVVQNLHIGGGGEDTYLIDKPGTYVLQINGAEAWRVWLEPQP